MINSGKKILRVCNVNKYFKKRSSLKQALKNISFDVNEGDFYGIIGESGSGKTTLGKSIIRLYDISGGNIYLYDRLISGKKISKENLKYAHMNMSMIFQDPMSSLNPKKNVFKSISEPIIISKEIKKNVKTILKNKQRINSIFQYFFLNKTEELFLTKSIEFLKSYIDIIDKTSEKLEQFDYSDKDNWISSFNELDEKYSEYISLMKINISNLNKIIDEEKNISNNKYLDEELDNSLKTYLNSKNLFNNEYAKLLNKYNCIKQDLLNYKTYISEKQKKNLLYIKYNDYKLQKKYHKNNAKISSDNISYWYENILSAKAKTYAIAIKPLLNLKHLDDFVILNSINFLFDIIDDYFTKLNDELFGAKLNNNYNEVFYKIKSHLEHKKLVYLIEDNAKNIYEELKIKDRNKQEKDHEIIHDLTSRLSALKNRMKHSKKENNQPKEIKLKVKNVFNKYKEIYSENKNKQFNLLKKEIKRLNSVIRKKYYKMLFLFHQKNIILYKLRPSGLSDFTKKEQNLIINKNKKSFKTQITTKRKTFRSIDWEYKNIIDNIFINKKLYSKSKLKLFFYKNDLVKLIILNQVYDLLESVGLKKEHAYRYPHEFSGGQRQRIVIARSLINRPKLIIADEAISALDVSIQAQVINILKKLCEINGVTFLFIAHDLSMVRYVCNKVIIMHNGSIVEKGCVDKVFSNPIHPYTKSLFMSIPELNKMDTDLASFNDNSEYEKDYSISNVPKFYKVSEDHEVLASEEQFKLWMK